MHHLSPFTLIIVTAALGLSACKEKAGFSGGAPRRPIAEATEAPEPSDTEDFGPDVTPEKPKKPEKPAKALTVTDSDDDEGSDKPNDNPTVTTVGSFSAWAEPPNPQRLQEYHLIIEVKLPSGVSSYGMQDLSGELIGTDDYRQTIGARPQFVPESGGEAFDMTPPAFSIKGRTARLDVVVPGALLPAVMDTVKIRSKLLNEEQTLYIKFR